ncbi:hypothetical protein WG904_17545 [Pedobacter sp. Du54]|uniref:hypothetical protein n=1 Tax=Pedobacter anseongensis TaxID=3133439 RepID=UPI0030A1E289
MDTEEFPVLKYTVQLYYSPAQNQQLDSDHSPPLQIASGVLVQTSKKFFLITCKHVFDNIKIDDVVILTSMGFAVRLPDSVKFLNDANDSIDLAIIELKSYRVSELKTVYSFLPYKYLGFSHEFDEELWYMLFGYVNKKTELEDKAFYAPTFGYLTTIRRYRNFEKLGFSYENNVSLEYSRKQSFLDEEVKMLGFKELKGMSGGGIWLSVAGRRRNTYNYILVGIMIEERIDRGFVIGTKIGLIEKHIN